MDIGALTFDILKLIHVNGETIKATQTGVDYTGDVEPVPTDPTELLNMWKNRLQPAWQKMLEKIYDAYPSEISFEELSEQSGILINVSTFRNGVSRLKSLGLILVHSKSVIMNEEFVS